MLATALLWLGATVIPAPATPLPPAEQAATIELRVSGGELTVDLRNAPLAQVLRIIGEQSGIEVRLRGDFAEPVTQSFAGVSLEDGIRRLAGGASVAVTYGRSPEDPAREVVTSVWVVAGSSRGGSATASARPPRPVPDAPARAAIVPERPDLPPAGDAPGAARTREIHALGTRALEGAPEAVARLAEISTSEEDVEVRHQAVAALGRLQGPVVEPALTAVLTDDDAAIRMRAVRGLRRVGTETSAQSLARVLGGDADPQVRLAALNALTSLPGGTMLRGLATAASDPDEAVRQAAIRGLSWWKLHLPGAR